MKKKLWVRACGVAAAGMLLAGCSAAAAAPAETTAPTIPTIRTEQLPQVMHPRTPDVSWPVGFAAGDQVWIVRHVSCTGPAAVVSGTVIAETGPYLVTAPEEYGSGEDLHDLCGTLIIWANEDVHCLDLIPIGDCYRTEQEAQAVADRENEEGCCG